MTALRRAAFAFTIGVLAGGCSVKDNWIYDLGVNTARDTAAEADGDWSDGAAGDYALDDASALDDATTDDGTTEDVVAEDVAAEDVAAEDVAAEDVAAEDVAAEDVAADETTPSDASVEPLLDASDFDASAPDVSPMGDLAEPDLDVGPELDVNTDLDSMPLDTATGLDVEPDDVSDLDTIDPSDSLTSDVVGPAAPVLQFGHLADGPSGLEFTQWIDGDTHEIVLGMQGQLHTEVIVRVLTAYTDSGLSVQLNCGTTEGDVLVGSFADGYYLASPAPGVYQSQTIALIFFGYEPVLYKDKLATITCQVDWIDPTTQAPISLSVATSGLLVDVLP